MHVIPASELTVSNIADTIRLAVAPVFLLSGIAAFVNVCASRLSRIVDRSRKIEPLLLGSRGAEHDRWLREINVIDQRMRLVSWAISLSVLSAILICAVVIMLFAGSIVRVHFGTAIALTFIGSMISIGVAFAVFLFETRVGSRAVRVRTDLLSHEVEDAD